VANFRLPKKFKASDIAIHTGLKDLIEHIENYQSHLDLHGTPDEIACRAFPLTLSGNAPDWFRKLSLKSIRDFDAFGKIFLTQFLVGRKRRNPAGCLMSLHQGPDESLEDYIIRFNQEKLATENLSKEFIFAALYQGIRKDGPLMAKLARKLSYSLMEVKKDPSYEKLRKILRKPPTLTANVYCTFHEVNGHNTETCISLRVLIEEKFIENGKLVRFLTDQRN
jgi:hypothetical protein